jgi:hypothetical protein
MINNLRSDRNGKPSITLMEDVSTAHHDTPYRTAEHRGWGVV